MSLVAALTPVVEVLERLGVAYQVGGSVVSSAYGSPRATNDVDLAADLRLEHVEPLCSALRRTYYADADLLREAIRRRTCANLIHLASGFKVDVFVCADTDYDRVALQRVLPYPLGEDPAGRTFLLSTPEDVLLRKLLWFRADGCVSDRQWADVVGVLRLRRGTLDRAYLEGWAQRLGVDDLLMRAEGEVERPVG